MTNIETERYEYKSSLSETREIIETVAAFATATGGCIHIGVNPNGQILGVQIGKSTLEDLANKIKQNTDPPQFPSIEIENINGRNIIKVFITENPLKPVYAFGRALKRVGRTNHHLTRYVFQRLTEV